MDGPRAVRAVAERDTRAGPRGIALFQARDDFLRAGERHKDEEPLQRVQGYECVPQRLQVDEARS